MDVRFLVGGVVLAACAGPDRAPPPSPEAPAPSPAAAAAPADYGAHVTALRHRLRGGPLAELAIDVELPFVVLAPDARTLEAGRDTVRWAADRLERDFFSHRPGRILDIYLFGDARSYERGAEAVTGEEPSTPYGFYASAQGALVMNIATGGGTLVHEIVHPYVEADFPDAPAWLNEGLGSLFEQSGDRDGHIVGRTNWRLAGLQRAIARGHLTGFRALTAMSDREFYAEASGTNYAQARYLMYYLQEHGQLLAFYRAFRAARASDPTGYDTLVAILDERDMAAFQRRWQAWVTELRFP